MPFGRVLSSEGSDTGQRRTREGNNLPIRFVYVGGKKGTVQIRPVPAGTAVGGRRTVETTPEDRRSSESPPERKRDTLERTSLYVPLPSVRTPEVDPIPRSKAAGALLTGLKEGKGSWHRQSGIPRAGASKVPVPGGMPLFRGDYRSLYHTFMLSMDPAIWVLLMRVPAYS